MPATSYTTKDKARLYQGDIFREFGHSIVKIVGEEAEVLNIDEPYVIVVSQDCDLQRDFEQRATTSTTHDKYVSDVILIPAYPAELFKQGDHLSNFGLKMMSSWSSEGWKVLQQNKNERYYFLSENLTLGVPNLVLDFKRYYTVSREDIYRSLEAKYVTTIAELFREDLSRRFANFISRIGLPE